MLARAFATHAIQPPSPRQLFPSIPTTVVSARLKVRFPVRTIRSTDAQLGSGHATRASEVIQSLACVTRCLAASSGRTEAAP